MAVVAACSPERLAELRAAFNDPQYTPAYCSPVGGAGITPTQIPVTSIPSPTGGGIQSTTTNTTTNTTQSVELSTPVLVGVALLVWFLFKKG